MRGEDPGASKDDSKSELRLLPGDTRIFLDRKGSRPDETLGRNRRKATKVPSDIGKGLQHPFSPVPR